MIVGPLTQPGHTREDIGGRVVKVVRLLQTVVFGAFLIGIKDIFECFMMVLNY